MYKPGGKNEAGGSIEEMVSRCGASWEQGERVETYFTTL